MYFNCILIRYSGGDSAELPSILTEALPSWAVLLHAGHSAVIQGENWWRLSSLNHCSLTDANNLFTNRGRSVFVFSPGRKSRTREKLCVMRRDNLLLIWHQWTEQADKCLHCFSVFEKLKQGGCQDAVIPMDLVWKRKFFFWSDIGKKGLSALYWTQGLLSHSCKCMLHRFLPV